MNDDKVFEIEGVEFVIDERPGTQRGKSTENRFILVKNTGCLDFIETGTRRNPIRSWKLACLKVAHLLCLTRYSSHEKMVGMDIRDEPIQPLETYVRNHSHIKTYYGSSQSDPVTLKIARQKLQRYRHRSCSRRCISSLRSYQSDIRNVVSNGDGRRTLHYRGLGMVLW